MLGRRLALVSGLTVGDYLLWDWSLNTNHGALALLSGLTLPPLTIALVWLLVLLAARAVARYPAWHMARTARSPRARARTAAGSRRPPAGRARPLDDPATAARQARASSDKLAA